MPAIDKVGVEVDERVKRLMRLLVTYQHKRFRNFRQLVETLVNEEAARVWTPEEIEAHLKEFES